MDQPVFLNEQKLYLSSKSTYLALIARPCTYCNAEKTLENPINNSGIFVSILATSYALTSTPVEVLAPTEVPMSAQTLVPAQTLAFALAQALALTLAQVFAPALDSPGRYLDEDLQRATKLTLESFV